MESNSGSGEAPACLCYLGGDCEVARERSGSGGFTLSRGVWCCKGTTRRVPHGGGLLVRCDLFSFVDAGSQRKVSMTT